MWDFLRNGKLVTPPSTDNILEGNHRKPNYLGLPTVCFTVLPLAAVGLGEAEAKKQGLKFKTNNGDTSEWYSSRRVNL